MFKNIKELVYNRQWPDKEFPIREICEIDLEGDWFRLFTYGDSIDIPIFHMVSMQYYKDIAICLFEPRIYQYNHSRDNECPFLLSVFNNKLKEINTKYSHLNMTNWEAIVDSWFFDHNAPELYKMKDQLKQPDYTKLESNKIMKRSLARTIISKWNA